MVRNLRSTGGFSMIEMVVALSIFGVMLNYSVPRFRYAFEQARVNLATANLQAVWTAQRLYWAENETFSADLDTLSTAGLLDPVFVTMSEDPAANFAYSIDASSASTFVASATRQNSAAWTGSVLIDQEGSVTGTVATTGMTIAPASLR